MSKSYYKSTLCTLNARGVTAKTSLGQEITFYFDAHYQRTKMSSETLQGSWEIKTFLMEVGLSQAKVSGCLSTSYCQAQFKPEIEIEIELS